MEYQYKAGLYKNRNGINEYKRNAIEVAEQLFYGKDVIKKIKKSKNENEIDNIMIQARRSIT